MGRIVLGLLAGLVVAGLTIFVIEALGHAVYPPPPGIDPRNPESLRSIIATLPAGAFAFVLLAWLLGSVAGAWTAVRMVGRRWLWPGLAVGAIVLAGVVYNMMALPHPTWMLPVALLGVPAATWIGAALARRGFGASAVS